MGITMTDLFSSWLLPPLNALLLFAPHWEKLKPRPV